MFKGAFRRQASVPEDDVEGFTTAPNRQESSADDMTRRISPQPAAPAPSSSQGPETSQAAENAQVTEVASPGLRTERTLSTEHGSVLGSLEGSTPTHRLTRSLSKMGSTVGHYLALVVAENPIEQHRQYLESQQDETHVARDDVEASLGAISEAEREASRHSMIAARWQGAARSVVSSHQMLRDFDTLGNPMSSAADKLAAAIELERKLAGNPHKRLLVEALERKRLNRFDNFFERLLNELFITGEAIFDWFTPAKLGQHYLFFTAGFTLAVFIIFFYMMGEFPYYILNTPHDLSIDVCLKNLETTTTTFGSTQFVRWVSPKDNVWCFKGNPWMMNADYLIQWGARWGPAMKSQPYRWFSSWFLHQSFQHILSNMLLFVAVAYQVEEKYGTWRITLLFFLSALGGNLFSAVFENNCVAVAGASGGVFGMLGLFIGDMILNFESLKRPILRSILMTCFLVYFIITVATSPAGTSHLSHVGGFICGLFPAFLFLPNLRSEKWEAGLPIAGGVVMVLIFTIFPIVFYKKILPTIGNCGLAPPPPPTG
ncbi:hypothetical protein WJX72_011823 [[Myrmecia] bisecta]|uniref:RHOMBOID-like protein n=1 Tax=[Myrmecia] bisecta TaxID=41462 RepID=A0AAW1P4E2_9CHLO